MVRVIRAGRPVSITNKAAIVGIGDTLTDRLGSKPGKPRKSNVEYLSWALHLALEDAGTSLKDFQGQVLGVTIPAAYPQPFGAEEVSEIPGRSGRRPAVDHQHHRLRARRCEIRNENHRAVRKSFRKSLVAEV